MILFGAFTMIDRRYNRYSNATVRLGNSEAHSVTNVTHPFRGVTDVTVLLNPICSALVNSRFIAKSIAKALLDFPGQIRSASTRVNEA